MTLSFVTALFVPADRPDRYAKAAAAGADAIIIDLEDAVAPHAKAAARAALQAPGSLPSNVPLIIRVNGRQTPWHMEDIACITALPVAGIMLPKTETGEDVLAISRIFGSLPLFALIESATGLAAAREIARMGAALRLAFGSIDFSADIRCAHTHQALLAARSELVVASALGRLPPPIDGVTTALNDQSTIMADVQHAAELGFGGKLCIHPSQVAPARRGFAPSEAEITWARRVIAVEEDRAIAIDGAMVDAPVRQRARRILTRASVVSQNNQKALSNDDN